jgi:signal transduction histidine kinase
MTGDSLPTRFAPAERASATELAEQAFYFAQREDMQRFLNAVSDVFLILNEQRQIVFANCALLDLLQTSAEQTIGQRPGEALDCVHAAEDGDGCGTTEFCQTCGAVKAILSALRGAEAVQECHILQKSGAALDLQVKTTPFRLSEQNYAFFAVMDISHEKRRRALERIFFHDILNTAGNVQGAVELLVKTPADEWEEIRDIMQSLAVKLVEEIQSQRQLLAAENRELAVHSVSIESLQLLAEVMAIYSKYETFAKRSVRLAADASPFTLFSDKVLLRRVLSNMLKNALEATPRGGVVTVGCRADGESAEFWVHNPTVMPREVQLQVFQRSFSTKGTDRGLGTYSMKLLSERYLRGSVSFTSTPEEGTIFRVRYPLQLEAEEAV